MPDVVIHDADEEPGVNTEPMATVNYVFRNMLADDTEENGGISQLLRNVETGCLSERQLRKLEKMRQDGNTPLYKNCPMSKLEADIELLEFKSTNRLNDKGFDKLLGIIRKMRPEKNELPEKTYLAKQMICPIGLKVEKKSKHVPMIAYCTVKTNTKTQMRAPSVKLHDIRKGPQMRVPRPDEVP
jgi:hypothetical protein